MRAAGFVLVFTISALAGKYFSEREMRKIAVCRELCGFLQYLCTAVSKSIRIDDIVASYFGKGTNTIIKAETRSELLKAFRREAENGSVKGLLSETELFLNRLGKAGGVYEETARSTEMLERAEKMSEEIICDSKKRKELYGRLGVILGLMVCIVLM